MIACSEDRGLRTKVGAADDSVLLDTEHLGWLAPAWAALSAHRRGKPLWSFNYRELFTAFARAAAAVGVIAVPYQLRHSGPAWDRVQKYRTQEEVMKRGRWKTMKSLVRYERHARLAAEMRDLAAPKAAFCRECAAQFEACVLRRAALPAPALSWRGSACLTSFLAAAGLLALSGLRASTPMKWTWCTASTSRRPPSCGVSAKKLAEATWSGSRRRRRAAASQSHETGQASSVTLPSRGADHS